jgi:hypothetical protein
VVRRRGRGGREILRFAAAGSDPAGAKRAIQAMMQMVKLDIAALKEAYEGKSAA